MTTYHLTASNRAGLHANIDRLDPTKDWTVTIVPFKAKRSNEQNKWLRGYADAFGKHLGYEADQAYELLMYKCNPVFKTDPENGFEIRLPGSFSTKPDGSKRNTKEAAEIQDIVWRFGESVGFTWGKPFTDEELARYGQQ